MSCIHQRSGGKEEILLEDMLEDTQAIQLSMGEGSGGSYGPSIIYQTLSKPEFDRFGYACET